MGKEKRKQNTCVRNWLMSAGSSSQHQDQKTSLFLYCHLQPFQEPDSLCAVCSCEFQLSRMQPLWELFLLFILAASCWNPQTFKNSRACINDLGRRQVRLRSENAWGTRGYWQWGNSKQSLTWRSEDRGILGDGSAFSQLQAAFAPQAARQLWVDGHALSIMTGTWRCGIQAKLQKGKISGYI